MAKIKFGYMPCPDCTERVVVKINEHETLSYGCDECGGNGYSKKSEWRYQLWLKKITRAQAPEPAPAAKKAEPPAPAPAAAAAPAKKASTLLG